MHPYHQAQNLIGVVYVHPVSQALVVFISYDSNFNDPMLRWSSVTGDKQGRVLVSTVLKGDGRWVKYEGYNGNSLLPYSHRS